MFGKAQLLNPARRTIRKPVERVCWRDAKQHCNERAWKDSSLGTMRRPDWDCDYTANGYRLPTEAEWEYALPRRRHDPDFGTPDKLRQHSWFADNAARKPRRRRKKPNRWAFSIYGNVSNGARTLIVQPTIRRVRL